MKKVYRTLKGRKIAGVCEGLGECFNIDPVILRALFIILIPFGGIGVISYIIMWIMLPARYEGDGGTMLAKRLYLSTADKRIAGVCGGLGEFFNVDPTFFRIGFLISVLFGGVIVYILLAVIVPRTPNPGERVQIKITDT